MENNDVNTPKNENNNIKEENNSQIPQQEGIKKERKFNKEYKERTSDDSSGERPYKKGRFSGGFKRKKCRFCSKEKKNIDKDLNYKNLDLLEKFVSDRGKLLPSRITGNCALHQRKIKVEVKKARYMAFLPFAKVEKINK